MNDDSTPQAAPREIAFTTRADPASASASAPASTSTPPRERLPSWLWFVLLALAALAIAALALAWRAEQRVRGSERELVKRQQEAALAVAESSLVAKQAQEGARDAAAKVALLEARVSEVALQRTQLEALVQSVARSRDEALVADSEAMLRAAMQQAALTGSAGPLVDALEQSEERLARADQPRLDPVRRAIARDLDRVRAASVADVATLALQLDEAVRLVDGLPLVSSAEPRRDLDRVQAASAAAAAAASPASAPASSSDGAVIAEGWSARALSDAGERLLASAWGEVRSLIRITRIDRPEAMLIAPEQTFFLKENLKLRLLNARLSILARQFDSAQGDLQWVLGAIERYFDKTAKKTQVAAELLRRVAQQARQPAAMRPDDTLAALAALGGTR